MGRPQRWNASAFLRFNSFGALRHHQDVSLLSLTVPFTFRSDCLQLHIPAIKNPASVAVSRVGKSLDPMIALPAYQKPIGVVRRLMFGQAARQAPAEHPAGDLGFTT